jgi:ABC-type molybdate transport system permease subunit
MTHAPPPKSMSARMIHDLTPLWLSLRVALVATVLIVACGVPLALLLARGRVPGKGLLAGALTLPLVLPPTVSRWWSSSCGSVGS